MFLGYNTNGFAHHRLEDTIDVIGELGYGGVALTLDVHHLNPFEPLPLTRAEEVRVWLRQAGMRCVVETGARFLLDPRKKHQPTLVSPTTDARRQRFDFLTECLFVADAVGADCLSLWSGTATDDAPTSEQMIRLVDQLRALCDFLDENFLEEPQPRLAFEPEPGMFIDTMDKFAELHARVNHPAFGLTIDVGHLVCNGELPVSKFLQEWKHVLWNVHIEDMRRGVHDHLMFGEGEVDFADVFAGLRAAGYEGGVYVELSRHSHDAVNTARKSKAFLEQYLGER